MEYQKIGHSNTNLNCKIEKTLATKHGFKGYKIQQFINTLTTSKIKKGKKTYAIKTMYNLFAYSKKKYPDLVAANSFSQKNVAAPFVLAEFFEKNQFPLLVTTQTRGNKKIHIPTISTKTKLRATLFYEISLALKNRKESTIESKIFSEYSDFLNNRGTLFELKKIKIDAVKRNSYMIKKPYIAKMRKKKKDQNAFKKNKFFYL